MKNVWRSKSHVFGDGRDAEAYGTNKNCTVMSASCVGGCDIHGAGAVNGKAESWCERNEDVAKKNQFYIENGLYYWSGRKLIVPFPLA